MIRSSGVAETRRIDGKQGVSATSALRALGALRPNWDVLAVLALFAGAFALYARTVTPGVLDADGGEFQTNIYRLGVSHTGYPLYFLLAKLWTLVVPVGTIAFRANLFSAFAGAAAAALVYPAMRVVARSRAAALFTAAFFAVSRVEWSQSLVPDVYTLNSFFIILIVLLAALARRGRFSPVWLAAAFGLSLTHHRTMMWFAPAIGAWLLMGEGRALFRPRRLLTYALAFLLPLVLYLYVPWRGNSDVGVEYHASGFAEMILAGNVSISLRLGPPAFLWGRLVGEYWPLMLEQFTPVGFALGLVGVVGLALGRSPSGFPREFSPRQWLLFIALAHVAETAFALVFWVVDSEIFFIPSYLTFLFLVGIGIAFALDGCALFVARVHATRFAAWLPTGLGIVGLSALIAWLLLGNFQRVDRSWDDEADLRWQEILAQPIEPGALIVGSWESLTPLEYYRYVDGVRTDLKRLKVVLYKDQLQLAPQPELDGLIRETLAAGQAVYLTRHPGDTETLGSLSDSFNLTPFATLWRIDSKASTAMRPLMADFGGEYSLKAIGVKSESMEAGQFLSATLEWEPGHAPNPDNTLSLVLRGPDGRAWAESSVPLNGGRAFEIQPGQPIREAEGLVIPPDAPPGQYVLDLALTPPNSSDPLPVGSARSVELAHFDISTPKQVVPAELLHIAHRLRLPFGAVTLLGYTLSDERPRAGDRIDLQTWWSGVENSDETLRVHLIDSNGKSYSLVDRRLFPDAQGPIQSEQAVRSWQTVLVPPAAAAGTARLEIALGEQRHLLAQIEISAGRRLFSLPSVQISQVAALGESIQFIGYNLNGDVKPGARLPITLFWHSSKETESSYKVFVHLLDGSGRLVAQKDALPRAGDLTTDRWLEGEYIEDDYALEIPPDLNAGLYSIEIGMYSAESGERLQALDETGNRVPDDAIRLKTPVKVTR